MSLSCCLACTKWASTAADPASLNVKGKYFAAAIRPRACGKRVAKECANVLCAVVAVGPLNPSEYVHCNGSCNLHLIMGGPVDTTTAGASMGQSLVEYMKSYVTVWSNTTCCKARKLRQPWSFNLPACIAVSSSTKWVSVGNCNGPDTRRFTW